MKKVLTIAGSDCSGGAGAQADIKTITAHRMYAESVLTALTAQNTTGVKEIMDVTPQFVAAQLDAVFTDIYPDAVKVGMVSNAAIITVIAFKLRKYKAKNIVVDPVMVSTAGSRLLKENAIAALSKELLPIADIITPNIPEAEVLCGKKIKSATEMGEAAKDIYKQIYKDNGREGAVLIKGGHLTDAADDVLCDAKLTYTYHDQRVNNSNTHGTGCTLSSAIACNLAAGYSSFESVKYAKKYIKLALSAQLNLGSGSGPLNHMAASQWITAQMLK